MDNKLRKQLRISAANVAKVYADAGQVILSGLKQYVAEVTGKTFPQPENWFGMKDEDYDELLGLLK